MAVDIHKLIGAISPDVYCSVRVRRRVKSVVKRDGYLQAAQCVELPDSDFMDFDEINFNPMTLPGLRSPIEKHSVTYDAKFEYLEPMYFWILDKLEAEYGTVEKLVDTFASSALLASELSVAAPTATSLPR